MDLLSILYLHCVTLIIHCHILFVPKLSAGSYTLWGQRPKYLRCPSGSQNSHAEHLIHIDLMTSSEFASSTGLLSVEDEVVRGKESIENYYVHAGGLQCDKVTVREAWDFGRQMLVPVECLPWARHFLVTFLSGGEESCCVLHFSLG